MRFINETVLIYNLNFSKSYIISFRAKDAFPSLLLSLLERNSLKRRYLLDLCQLYTEKRHEKLRT